MPVNPTGNQLNVQTTALESANNERELNSAASGLTGNQVPVGRLVNLMPPSTEDEWRVKVMDLEMQLELSRTERNVTQLSEIKQIVNESVTRSVTDLLQRYNDKVIGPRFNSLGDQVVQLYLKNEQQYGSLSFGVKQENQATAQNLNRILQCMEGVETHVAQILLNTTFTGPQPGLQPSPVDRVTVGTMTLEIPFVNNPVYASAKARVETQQVQRKEASRCGAHSSTGQMSTDRLASRCGALRYDQQQTATSGGSQGDIQGPIPQYQTINTSNSGGFQFPPGVSTESRASLGGAPRFRLGFSAGNQFGSSLGARSGFSHTGAHGFNTEVSGFRNLRQDRGFGSVQQQGADAFMDAIRSIRINTTQSTPIPKFNMLKNTAEEYLMEVERYYRACNYGPDQYLYMLNTILPKDVKLWWDHYKTSIQTWDEFADLFVAKYDTCLQANERMRALQTRMQRHDDPTDVFIYEMVKLSKIVYPREPIQQTIERTREALNPRLRVGLGAKTFSSPEEMLEAVRLVYAGLVAQDKASNVKSDIPPITGGSSSSYVRNSGRNSSRSSSESSTEEQDNQSDRSGTRRYRDGSHDRDDSFQSQEGRGNSSDSDQEKYRRDGNNSTATPGYRNAEVKANTQCYKCRGYGHTMDQCPNEHGYATAALSEDCENSFTEEGLQNTAPYSFSENQ